MSFTTVVKEEIGKNRLFDCCAKAELSALVKICSTISIANRSMQINIKTENPTTAKRIYRMLKEQYEIETQISVIKKMKLKKNNIYVIKVLNRAKEILNELSILDESGLRDKPLRNIVAKDCCARAYLAGAFLASGSVNSPIKPNYHLEIAFAEEEFALFIQKLMARFDLPAKLIKRRNQHVVYLKASDKISDFLRCVGAHNGVMQFEDQRIQRDFRNNFTRLDNCEFANEVKTLKAGQDQIQDIELIQNHSSLDFLDEKFKTIALLRLNNPQASLNELCEIYEEHTGVTITKSGMKHRFTKIKEIAKNIRQEKGIE